MSRMMFDMSQWFCLTLLSLFVCRLTLANIIWTPERNYWPRRKQMRYGISAPLIRASARESRLLRITRTTTWVNLPDLATTNLTDKQSGLDPNTARNSARAYAWDVMINYGTASNFLLGVLKNFSYTHPPFRNGYVCFLSQTNQVL